MQRSQLAKRGNWEEQKLLGTGGFGTVTLWQNKENGEQLALKICRVQNEMTEKHRHRWKLEIDIMKRLQHDNVITALNVPHELDVSREAMPVLAMEYCSEGDLRKVLNKPENCCGMKEYDIRYLVQDIAAAIEYLHGNRIIHRDLKPENIVLHHVDERIVYKLIDLGYAKELDQGSVCTSFVGTLQYLAPELFASQRYQCTVDYWSFGTVVFECISGYRPFLPNIPPVRWHKEVSTKSPDDISAQFDSKGEVKFSKKLPSPNHLSRTLKGYFEHWLRLMLRWDPNQRGGGIVPETKRPKCFNVLEHILALKIVHILNIEANQIITYPVTEQHTMLDLQRIIEQETKIPLNEQDILLASGSCPNPNGSAYQCWTEPIEEEWVVFLFRKVEPFPIPRKNKQLPQLVQLIVKQPKTLLPIIEQRKAWAHAVCFCQDQNTDYKRLILGQRAAMLNLLRTNSQFLKLKAKMSSDIGQLLARKEHFKESLAFDITQYKEQAASGGISSAKMFAKWMKTSEDIEKFSDLKDKVNRLDQHCTVIQTKIVELQRSPFARMKQNDALVQSQEHAREMYQKLIKSSRESQHYLIDHTEMVQAVVKCALQRDKSDKSVMVLYTHLGKISACRYELQKILPELEECCEEIEAASRQLMTHQQHRQQDIWKLLKLALKKKQGISLSRSNSHTSNPYCSLPGPTSDVSLGNPESLRLVEEGKTQTKRFNELMLSMREEEEESMSLATSMNQVISAAIPTTLQDSNTNNEHTADMSTTLQDSNTNNEHTAAIPTTLQDSNTNNEHTADMSTTLQDSNTNNEHTAAIPTTLQDSNTNNEHTADMSRPS